MVSITQIMDKDDVKCINTLINKSSLKIELGVGFCSSYKRLIDKTKGGTHSPALVELAELINMLKCRSNDKVILHYSPSSHSGFYDEIYSLLEYDNIKKFIDVLFITSVWPEPQDIKKIKQRYDKIDITVQLPLYRMRDTSIPEICNRLLKYEGYVDYVSVDSSGGKGIEIDAKYSIQLINGMKEYDNKLKWFVAGGVYGGNVKSIIKNIFLGTSESISIDAESRLRTEGKLSIKKVTEYVIKANAAYVDLGIGR